LKNKEETFSVTEILKSLIQQVLIFHLHFEYCVHYIHGATKLLGAYSEEDYVDLLVKSLQYFNIAYLIVELGAI
jgi:hypothetical protein